MMDQVIFNNRFGDAYTAVVPIKFAAATIALVTRYRAVVAFMLFDKPGHCGSAIWTLHELAENVPLI